MRLSNPRIRWIWTYEPSKKVRLAKLIFSVNGGPENQRVGYDVAFSVNLVSRLFAAHKDSGDARLALCGIELHVKRSYGGHLS